MTYVIPETIFGFHIFVPIEDIFGHWYYMVIDYAVKTAYHLDSYPDRNMVVDREKLMEKWCLMSHLKLLNLCVSSHNSGAWVIQWLEPHGNFKSLDISGVLDYSTLRWNGWSGFSRRGPFKLGGMVGPVLSKAMAKGFKEVTGGPLIHTLVADMFMVGLD
ncbi:hypothetical protein PIB30_045374 [Stylosanthes scabra]|uniref:Ubiquitin-like protease family profile domain-containing protein n=1 Tax=Stylosanthes scabra TaxID=79078 RepID=A0ABU6TFU0_9FABA|nr:hypothetical protein [Stylosanthes scabra]